MRLGKKALVLGTVVLVLLLAGGMVATARPSLSALDVDSLGDGGATALPAAAALADPLFVNKFYVKPGGDDTNWCVSWADACATIQGAIDEALPDATINVQVGQYQEMLQIGKSVTIVGGQEGSSPVSTLFHEEPTATEILGVAGGPPVVVNADGVTLRDLQLGGGAVPLNGVGGFSGDFGVLLCLGSSELHLENCDINYPVEVMVGASDACAFEVHYPG